MFRYLTLAIIIGIGIYVYLTIRAEGFQNQGPPAPVIKGNLQKVVEYFERIMTEKQNSKNSTVLQYIPKLQESSAKLKSLLSATSGDDSSIVSNITMKDV